MHITKMHGAGNDFVIVNNLEQRLPPEVFPEQLPIAFPIAQAIGDLVDPPATMVNAAGDYVASYIVSRYNDGKDWLQKKLQRDAAGTAANGSGQ